MCWCVAGFIVLVIVVAAVVVEAAVNLASVAAERSRKRRAGDEATGATGQQGC